MTEPIKQQPHKPAAAIVHVASSFSGPIPPPNVLKQYDDVVPGAAERILRMAEQGIRIETCNLSKEALLEQYTLAMEIHEALRPNRFKFRLFDAYLEDLLGWLTPLAFNLAANSLVDEAARLGLAWADIREPEIFLADRAVILAEAGREAEAREQIERILKLFAQDVWVQIKAGDAYAALKGWSEAEERYRLARTLADSEDDRSAIVERLIRMFRQSARTVDAQALEAEENRRLEEKRRQEEEARARWTPVVREGPKIVCNDPCPCGSGKKFKKCCIDKPA